MKKPTAEKHEVFKTTLEFLSDMALELNGKKIKYSDADLVHATQVFMEIYLSKTFDFKKGTMPEGYSENLGREFRSMVLKDTGVDLHVAVKELFK